MSIEGEESPTNFLMKNLFRGLIGFAVIISAFIFFEDYFQTNFTSFLRNIEDRPELLYLVFFGSEVFFGLVPPEFFMMIWVLNKIDLLNFCFNLGFLTLISYGAGVIGYFVGYYFSKRKGFKKVFIKYLAPYEDLLRRYGFYLVFVGAVTPLPFSATCMVAGSVRLNFKQFLLISVSRILRFAVYGWMVWKFPIWF